MANRPLRRLHVPLRNHLLQSTLRCACWTPCPTTLQQPTADAAVCSMIARPTLPHQTGSGVQSPAAPIPTCPTSNLDKPQLNVRQPTADVSVRRSASHGCKFRSCVAVAVVPVAELLGVSIAVAVAVPVAAAVGCSCISIRSTQGSRRTRSSRSSGSSRISSRVPVEVGGSGSSACSC